MPILYILMLSSVHIRDDREKHRRKAKKSLPKANLKQKYKIYIKTLKKQKYDSDFA